MSRNVGMTAGFDRTTAALEGDENPAGTISVCGNQLKPPLTVIRMMPFCAAGCALSEVRRGAGYELAAI